MLTDAVPMTMPQLQRIPFVQVPQQLLTLPHGEYKTYCVLLTYTNYRTNGNRCWPSLAAIAAQAGLAGTDQVRRYIRKLEERHAVRVEYRGDTSNLYYLRYLVTNGYVVDAGEAVPALSAAQLRTLVEAAVPSSEAQVTVLPGEPLPPICQGGLADPVGGASETATGGMHIRKPNQNKQPDPETQIQEQQQSRERAAASEQVDAVTQELFTRLIALGMLETEARKLLIASDHSLVAATLDEATERADIQNPAGWILRVVRYRKHDITCKPGTGGRAGKYLPNLPVASGERHECAMPDPVEGTVTPLRTDDQRSVLAACGENGSDERELPAEQNLTADVPSLSADLCSSEWGGSDGSGKHPSEARAACPTRMCELGNQILAPPAAGWDSTDSGEMLRRRALPVLIRWEKPLVGFPPLSEASCTSGEQALDALARHARQSLALQLEPDQFDRRVLAWADQNRRPVAA